MKDYYYIPPNDIPEVFTKATRYCLPYCESCNISVLYEIGEVYGMADHEPLYCPKCKVQLTEVRSDANHRVIKLFLGKKKSSAKIDKVKAKHIFITRNEWQSQAFIHGMNEEEINLNICYICKHEFCEHPPTQYRMEYENKNICSECMMSERTLLVDYQFL